MHDRFFHFIESPTAENYQELRQWFLATEAYDPYTDDLLDIVQMVDEGRYDDATVALDRSMPNLLLTPRAHLLAAATAEHQGDAQLAEAERIAANACVQGILSTGDGSQDRPYLVTRTADEFDVLSFLGKQPRVQSLHHRGDRHLDEIRTTDDAVLWFDITDAYDKMSEDHMSEQLERIFRDEAEGIP